jgi:hypothetical protein
MNVIYVVIENGNPYDSAYTTFASALLAVQETHKETIEEQLKEANGEPICSDIDVPEDTTGKTYMYIEKGIHIYIHKLPFLHNILRPVNSDV